MIFNMSGGGGGSGGLNFAIVGGLTQPATPKENTIWVKTETKIPGWVFSPTEPMNPESGMVFFKTDLTSSVGFNALRKNEIAVLPTSAQQYIGGQWKNMEAYAYIGGTWVQFGFERQYLYNSGAWNTNLTGEWVAQGMLVGNPSNPALTPYVAKNATDFKVYYNTGNNGSGIYRIGKKINLTNFKSLYFEGEMGGSDVVGLNVWSNLGGTVPQNRDAVLGRYGIVSGVGTLDVSNLTGDYYVGFNVYANSGVAYSYVVCKKLYLS